MGLGLGLYPFILNFKIKKNDKLNFVLDLKFGLFYRSFFLIHQVIIILFNVSNNIPDGIGQKS